jgi:REP element-mobilizing transposase RayT
MTQARKNLVSVEDTPYYHLVTRGVRRTFLCGIDKTSGKNYEHRRQWIEDRIRVLPSLFAIDLCAYAVLSNHIHMSLLGQVVCSCKTCIHHLHVNKSRFQSQALLSEEALLSCMVYVDLNPIRANIAATPESSECTTTRE